MRTGIFADSHDHLDHIRRAVACFNHNACQCVVFAGDLVSTFAVPPLRQLRCPMIACFGDNEGNKVGLQAGFGIIGQLGEPPFSYRADDGTRFLVAHMQKQIRGLSGDFDVAVYGHTHKPRIYKDDRGRLFINPGETSGWTFNDPTVVLLETETMTAELVHLTKTSLSYPGTVSSSGG